LASFFCYIIPHLSPTFWTSLNKRKIVTAVETGGPYESEIEMLRKALKKLQPQKGLPFIADKGYGCGRYYRNPFG
jgi:hypothetical protein